MISYKRDVSEFLRNKDGQRLSNLWREALQISSSTVHNIIKSFRELQKYLCLRDKAEDLCWMPVVFRPSDDTIGLGDNSITIIIAKCILNIKTLFMHLFMHEMSLWAALNSVYKHLNAIQMQLLCFLCIAKMNFVNTDLICLVTAQMSYILIKCKIFTQNIDDAHF